MRRYFEEALSKFVVLEDADVSVLAFLIFFILYYLHSRRSFISMVPTFICAGAVL